MTAHSASVGARRAAAAERPRRARDAIIPHPTTAEQRLKIAKYVIAMQEAGLPDEFVADVMSLAQHDQGVFDLLELWAEAEADPTERDKLVADLQEALDEERELPRAVQEKPKVPFDDLDRIAGDILAYKRRLRALIDSRGGVSEVARKAGIPQPSLSRMLSSASMPRRTTLYKIARALDVSEAEIVTEWLR